MSLVIQVRDIIRHSTFRVNAPEGTELEFKQKVLLKSSKEKVVAEVRQLPNDIPNVKVSDDFVFDRVLTDKEFETFEASQEGEVERIKKAQAEADKLNINMRFFASRIGWNGKVYAFLFTSENPVDFRELLKVMSRMFNGRIHLQRVDPRDRAEIMEGVGSCGCLHCCTTLRLKQEKVSLDAVRDQGIMIRGNGKIYDTSGKIKSCYLYELPMYRKYRKYLPHMRQEVRHEGQKARVVALDILNGRVKVELLESDNIEFLSVNDIEYPNQVPFPDQPLEFEMQELTLDGDLKF